MKQRRRRGPALTIFLVLVALLALFSTAGNAIVLFGSSAATDLSRAGIPPWTFYAFAIIAVLRLVAVAAIWFWRRSGVVLYIALPAVVIPMCFYIGEPGGLSGIVGVALLVALVRDKWTDMQWP